MKREACEVAIWRTRVSNMATTVLCAALLVAVAVGGCGSVRPRSSEQRPVMSQYNGWSISVTPWFADTANRWGAQVDVWPPDRRPDTHSGIRVRFDQMAADRIAIEKMATAAARQYIDASSAVHR